MLVQVSESQVGRALRTKRFKYIVAAPDLGGFDVPDAPLYREEMLYDLMADPHELTNLAGLESYRDIADSLKEKLIRKMVEAGEAEPKIENAEPRKAGQRKIVNLEQYFKV